MLWQREASAYHRNIITKNKFILGDNLLNKHHPHLAKMPGLAKWLDSDLSKGFTVPQVAQKHDWPESMVWSQALKGAEMEILDKESHKIMKNIKDLI